VHRELASWFRLGPVKAEMQKLGSYNFSRLNSVYTNPVSTSRETHYVSATKTDRLMLFGETLFIGNVAVYCVNYKKHVSALCEQSAEFLMLKQVLHFLTTVIRSVKMYNFLPT
jgi:hypothetical protein